MTDLATTLGGNPQPDTLERPDEANAAVVQTPGPGLPQGVHPRDNSAPYVPGPGIDSNAPTHKDNLGPQGQRRKPPWNTDNEEAFPVYQRAAHDWSANQYTVHSNNPIAVAGRKKGRTSVVVWVPTTAAEGVLISPDEGDLTQGAGVVLSPGDSIELPTEAPVWAGVIIGQSTGTVYVVEYYNPPGGGLGLSSS
jgi:hypothetical protein